MHKKVLRWVFMGLLAISSAQAQRGIDPIWIDTIIAKQMERYKVPGLGFALVVDGKIVHSKGYGVGNIASQNVVNSDTIFAIGSVAKSITSTAILQQVATRKIRLDAPVLEYLPKLEFSDKALGKKVTVRQILSHSSGLTRSDAWIANSQINSRAKLLETVAGIPFLTAPGSTFDYSNQNYTIASAILESVTAQRWEQYLAQNVFRPLGMTRASFSYTAARQDGNVASPYRLTSKGLQHLSDWDLPNVDDYLSTAGPTGGILASVNDMIQFVQFQLGGKTSVLPQPLLEEMQQLQIPIGHAYDSNPLATLDQLRGYGLGWFIEEYRGWRGFGHGGSVPGFTSKVSLIPAQRIGVVMLANVGNANDFLETTRLMILEELFNIQPRSDFSHSPLAAQIAAVSHRQDYQANPNLQKQLVGRYALVDGGFSEIVLEPSGLAVLSFGGRFSLIALSDTVYAVESPRETIFIEIKIDSAGMVWIYHNGRLFAIRLGSPTASITQTLTDPQNRYSLVLPTGFEIAQTTPSFTLATFKPPPADFVFAVTPFQGSLEQSTAVFLKTIDPNLEFKAIQTNTLPAINGIVWTQMAALLPNNQGAIVFATQKGNDVYLIAARGAARDAAAFQEIFQQLLSSYKIP